MTSHAVVVENISVVYKTYLDPIQTLRSRLKRGTRIRRRFHEIEAIKDVSFVLSRGESVGVIGHNGAGKSTLLLAMAGLTALQSGSIRTTSRPGLLSGSATLQPRLSGRRNLEMGCLALGASRQEVSAHADEYLTFAGLKEFADIPITAYSTGMRSRLAFTIATTVAPDLLFIDESLSAGDREFDKRARQRIDELTADARCVVIVSHNLAALERLCGRVIWLNQGRLVADGKPSQVISAYKQQVT